MFTSSRFASLKRIWADQSTRVLIAAIAFYLLAEALDILGTTLVMAYVPGSIEMNVLMRDPVTLKFVLGLGLKVKALGAAFSTVLPAIFLYGATASPAWASAPFWFDGMGTLSAVAWNFAVLTH